MEVWRGSWVLELRGKVGSEMSWPGGPKEEADQGVPQASAARDPTVRETQQGN